jgi:hypothetical protein
MKKYNLDDLMDWGRVLGEMRELREQGLLDQHQDGLKRILRYRRNWRLRECALECAGKLSTPRKELVTEVCSVMCDEASYPALRIRAAEVLRDLVRKRAQDGGAVPSSEGVSIPDRIRSLLEVPLNPLLARTLQQVLGEIGQMALENREPDVPYDTGTEAK